MIKDPVPLARRCDVLGCSYTAGIGVSRCFRHRAPLPTVWPTWSEAPPIGTIVHIAAMSHLNVDQKRFAPLPRGMFAILTGRGGEDNGYLRVLTLPDGIEAVPGFDEWSWHDWFPFAMGKTFSHESNNIILERVPEFVVDGVTAFAHLLGVLTDDRYAEVQPARVEAGWLAS